MVRGKLAANELINRTARLPSHPNLGAFVQWRELTACDPVSKAAAIAKRLPRDGRKMDTNRPVAIALHETKPQRSATGRDI
jgi:hypothetical protein